MSLQFYWHQACLVVQWFWLSPAYLWYQRPFASTLSFPDRHQSCGRQHHECVGYAAVTKWKLLDTEKSHGEKKYVPRRFHPSNHIEFFKRESSQSLQFSSVNLWLSRLLMMFSILSNQIKKWVVQLTMQIYPSNQDLLCHIQTYLWDCLFETQPAWSQHSRKFCHKLSFFLKANLWHDTAQHIQQYILCFQTKVIVCNTYNVHTYNIYLGICEVFVCP